MHRWQVERTTWHQWVLRPVEKGNGWTGNCCEAVAKGIWRVGHMGTTWRSRDWVSHRVIKPVPRSSLTLPVCIPSGGPTVIRLITATRYLPSVSCLGCHSRYLGDWVDWLESTLSCWSGTQTVLIRLPCSLGVWGTPGWSYPISYEELPGATGFVVGDWLCLRIIKHSDDVI